MILTVQSRKDLLLALLSVERLYLIYSKTSYFEPNVIRHFLDALWETVQTGKMPPKRIAKQTQRFIRSNVPSEDECFGKDIYGQPLISAIELLCEQFEGIDHDAPGYLANESEMILLDQYLWEALGPGKTTDPDSQTENMILDDRRMERLRSQLDTDRVRVAASGLTFDEIRDIRESSIFDLQEP